MNNQTETEGEEIDRRKEEKKKIGARRREQGGARGKLMMLFKNAQSPHYPAAAVAKQADRVTFTVERKTANVCA